MKRLIGINLLLITAVTLIPEKQITIPVVEEVAIVETISSRSSIDRTEETDNPVTTYSDNCVELVKKYEGLHLEAYYNSLDNDGMYTIGYGTHNNQIKSGQTITEEEADRLLRAELTGTCEYIIKYFDGYMELNQNELDALTSMFYNLGCGWLSTFTANKTRTKEELAEHITSYTSGGIQGLINRRNEELKLFKGEI